MSGARRGFELGLANAGVWREGTDWGSRKPKGCIFESYTMSQIYSLRVLSTFTFYEDLAPTRKFVRYDLSRPSGCQGARPSRWPILAQNALLV